METSLVETPPETHDSGKGAARWAGAIGAAAALVFLWGYSMVFDHAPFAPQALAERFLRATPGDIATFFIENLGHWARRSLTLSALLLTIVFGGEVLARTRREGEIKPKMTGAILAALAFVASLTSPSISANVPQTLLGSLLAIPLYSLVATSVFRALQAELDHDESRRRALKVGLIATASLAAGAALVKAVASRFSGPNTDVPLVAPAQGVAPPADGDFPDIPGLTPEVTSVVDHYVVDINLVQPSVDADTWTLKVTGAVDHPDEFTFEGLQKSFEVVEEYVLLTCISNEVGGDLIGNSAWGGVRLKDILEAAGPQSEAMDVVFHAADGYTDSIPLEIAMDEANVVAVSQNGQPLLQEHGFPCRVRIPQIYGMKNVKWLQQIELVRSDYQGYWQKRGWSDDATIKTASRIDVAGDDYSASVGQETWIAGMAWAGTRSISKVEVSVDGGTTWATAQLKEPLSKYSWRQWAYRWTPASAGQTTVVVRATDGEGETQSSEPAAPHPDGSSGYHSVGVSVA